MWILLLGVTLLTIVYADNNSCINTFALFDGVSYFNSTLSNAGEENETSSRSVWFEYAGTCVGEAHICVQSNGQCVTGDMFDLASNSFYSDFVCDSSSSNSSARSLTCEDNDSVFAASCANFGCGANVSEFFSFPTSIGTRTKFMISSKNDTFPGQLRLSVSCDARNVKLTGAPLVVTREEVVLLSLSSSFALFNTSERALVSLYRDSKCYGVVLSDNQSFECGRGGTAEVETVFGNESCVFDSNISSSNVCQVKFNVSVSPGVFYWFSSSSSSNTTNSSCLLKSYPSYRFSGSPLIVLPNCSLSPLEPCCAFCSNNLVNCSETYSDLRACQLACRSWLRASINDTSGNSLECRTNWGSTGNVSDCSSTAAAGGGVCIPSCSSFCCVQASECGITQFDNITHCTQQCASWPQGSYDAIAGNSLSCRWNQLVSKQQGGGAVCTDTGLLSEMCSNANSSAPSSVSLVPSTSSPTAAPSSTTPTRSLAPTTQACPGPTLANFYKYCKNTDFVGTGRCKNSNGKAPCTLMCRLYAETLEKQLKIGMGACPTSPLSAFAECAAFCIRTANGMSQLNSTSLTCIDTSLEAGLPMCGFGAVGSASSVFSLSLLAVIFGLLVM